MGGNVIAFFFC